MPADSIITVSTFLARQQRQYPEATGEFTHLLRDIITGCQSIGREVRQFGISSYQRTTGVINVQQEEEHELDKLADKLLTEQLMEGGEVCAIGSEERKEIVTLPPDYRRGHYVVMFDPLDGFSNIGVNINTGTIFSVRRKVSPGPDGTLVDFLQPGTNQVCAGYVMYGPAMVLVFTTGHGVHEFTYKPEIGMFILSRENIKMPKLSDLPSDDKGIYSVNQGYFHLWDKPTQAVVQHFVDRGFSSRHVGSLVADFHRTLLTGGIFAYPANTKSPNGKLRMLCELAPLAMVAEQAGGYASDGKRRILDIMPEKLHQRSPVYIGSTDAVKKAEEILAG